MLGILLTNTPLRILEISRGGCLLESSQFIARKEGASGAHSDIDGPQVAHAMWQAALVS